MSASASVPPEPAIVAENIGKQYRDRVVLDNVSLRVAPGTFYGFLGANGAGKSTLMRILNGLAAPTSGQARVAGCDPQTDPLTLKSRIGTVSEDIALYEKLSAGEFLEWMGRMRGLTPTESARRTAELLALLRLSGTDADRAIAEYSLGMKKKTALAAALLHAPRVLFLDEPFNGVDALSVRILCAVLTELTRRGVTIFFTSHVFETVERLCDHAAVLAGGRIVAEGTIDDLKRQAGAGVDVTLESAFAQLIGAGEPAEVGGASLAWFGGQ